MTTVPAAPIEPLPSEIVIFFPPGVARHADSCCTLSSGATPLCRITLRRGAAAVDIVAGEAASLPTAARSPDRPVFVCIAADGRSAACQIGAHPPVTMPSLRAAFGFDRAELSTGLEIDRISSAADLVPGLARGLGEGAIRAGAIDHVSRSGGIAGWIVDLARPADPHDVELRCGDVLLARTRADRPRPAAAPLVDRAPLGRFSVPWADIDRTALDRVAPDTPVTVTVPALGARLDHAYRPISARTARALAGAVVELGGAAASRITLAAPRISAVIPNYDYAHYLPQRIDSLLAQDAALELILLDDASTDDSLAVALDVAARAGREIQLVTSPRNSGGVLPQWRRAATLARGDYLLVAEADDEAEPTLVSTLAALLDAHPDMAFAFSDSAEIDAAGAVTRADFKGYYAALGDRALESERVFAAGAFLLRFLVPRNLVVNVSAVLWRTAALRAAFERLGPAIADFRAAGDWRVYIEACLAGGTIGYVPAPLNRFRRHAGSVVGGYTRVQHIAEVAAIHALLLSLCSGDATIAARLADHRAALRRLWSLPPVMDEAGDPA